MAMTIYEPTNGIANFGDIKRTTAHDIGTTDPQ